MGKETRKKTRRIKKRQKQLLYRTLHSEEKGRFYKVKICVGVLFRFIALMLKIFWSLVGIGVVCSIVVGVLAYKKYMPVYKEYKEFAKELVEPLTNADFKIHQASYVYGDEGNVIAILRENAESKYLAYEDIPQTVVQAFIAVEDRTFWGNDGADYKGIIRVCWNAVKTKGKELHGASTITQQLARNNFLTREVSLERKGKEILVAQELTKKFAKTEIIEFYINDICYANGIYGIEGASKAYFNKSVNELSLSQIAYLCAIPNSPTYYDPYVDPTRAIERRNKILNDMYECGYISLGEMNSAIAEEIKIEKPKVIFNDTETTYAVDCAVKYLMKLNGFEFKYKFKNMKEFNKYHELYDTEFENTRHKLYTGGYKIYTTLNHEKYLALQEILDSHFEEHEEVNEETGIYDLQGALTVIDNSNGKVVAMVGGRSQNGREGVYSLNRAYQAYRQPGSSIKPIIIYTPALEMGYTDKSMIPNISISSAKDKDVDIKTLSGESKSIRSAVEWSSNGCAWKVFHDITPAVGLSYAENMHYSMLCPNDYFDASALGGMTYGVSTVEQCSAFATIANHGVFREPTCLVSIKDYMGAEVYKEYEPIKVYEPYSADLSLDIMRGVIKSGTASKIGWYKSDCKNIDVFGKTGTTNDYKDGWLCGATPYYSLAVWVGYDTPKPMGNSVGNNYPKFLWKDAMLYLNEGLEDAQFEEYEYEEGEEKVNHLDLSNSENYYSYMEGRDDNEVLSDGYTVRDYRTDRVIGEEVTAIVKKMSDCPLEQVSGLYYSGLNIVNERIYSNNYSNELKGDLDRVLNERLNPVAVPVDPITGQPIPQQQEVGGLGWSEQQENQGHEVDQMYNELPTEGEVGGLGWDEYNDLPLE